MAQAPHPPRSIRWRKFLVKSTVWLSSELVLGMIGADTLADYSEFLMQNRVADHLGNAIAAITTLM